MSSTLVAPLSDKEINNVLAISFRTVSICISHRSLTYPRDKDTQKVKSKKQLSLSPFNTNILFFNKTHWGYKSVYRTESRNLHPGSSFIWWVFRSTCAYKLGHGSKAAWARVFLMGMTAFDPPLAHQGCASPSFVAKDTKAQSRKQAKKRHTAWKMQRALARFHRPQSL